MATSSDSSPWFQYYSFLSSDCSCVNYIPAVAQCRTCPIDCSGTPYCPGQSLTAARAVNTQKIIQKQVRAPSSLLTMNLAALNIGSNVGYVLPWRQSSDRRRGANSMILQPHVVPSHGNSTKRSLTRLRPGAAAAGGKGEDIKHNSYARYLGRLKYKNVREERPTGLTPLWGNKTRKYGMVSFDGLRDGSGCPILCNDEAYNRQLYYGNRSGQLRLWNNY